MNIIIRGKHIELTDALKEYVMKRVGKLAKYSDEFMDVQVTLLVERDGIGSRLLPHFTV